MKNGVCPKCGSKEIYVRREAGGRGSIYGLQLSDYIFKLKTTAPLDYYACADCGYVEHYISHGTDRRWIKENWTKVN